MQEKINNLSKINLLVTIDENYLSALSTMLSTYTLHHRNTETDVYVMHSSLSEADFDFLQGSVPDEFIKIKSIKITDRYFGDIPDRKSVV